MRFIMGSAAACAALSALALLAGCGTPPPPLPKTPEQTWALSPGQNDFAEALARYGAGMSSEAKHDLDQALTNYMQAAQLDPDNEELHFQVAMALIQRKQYNDALQLIDGLCKRKPKSEKALLWLALIYRATDQTDKALAVYERAIAVAPTSTVAYIETASIYSKTGRQNDAIKLLERGINKVDKPADLLRVLAGIYLRSSKDPNQTVTPEQISKAIRLIEKAVETDPDDQALLYQLGDLYILNHQVEKAVVCFEQIEKRNPDDLGIKQKLAMSFLAVGDKDKAIATLEGLSAKQPGNARILFYLAELYDQGEDHAKATEVYERITKLPNPDPVAFLKLALLKSQESPEKAIDILLSGIEKAPDEARLHEMLAYIYVSQGKYEVALKPFADATQLMDKNHTRPFVDSFYLKYAIASQLAGHTTEAAGLLYRAMGINPSYLDAYMQYIFQATEQSNITQSVSVLNFIGERKPDDPSLFLYLGLLNSYAKLYPAALTAFEKAEQLAAESPDKDEILTPLFYFWYAAACERSSQIARAEKYFYKCIELDPDHAEAYNYLAYMWAEQGTNLDKAGEMVRKALKIDPTSGAFIDTLGWVYFMQGNYPEALKSIGKASEIMPDDSTIVEHMGSVYDKLGDKDKARDYWTRSFTLDPDNDKLADRLKALGIDLEPLRAKARDLKATQDKQDKDQDDQEILPDTNNLEPEAPADTNAAPDEPATMPTEPDDLPVPAPINPL